MLPLYQQFLNGTLISSATNSELGTVNCNNLTSIPLVLALIDTTGTVIPLWAIDPTPLGTPSSQPEMPINWYFGFLTPDGALVSVYDVPTTPAPEGGTIEITVSVLDVSRPGDIGAIPDPTSSIPIPANTGSVMVGCGLLPNGNYLCRTQLYILSADSTSLAKGECLTTSVTETHGLNSISSTTDVVSTAVSSTASAGWGPISASISASMSTSHTAFQQYSITDTTTKYYSQTHDNSSGTDVISVFRWVLNDSVTIYQAKTTTPIAQIVTTKNPAVVREYIGVPQDSSKPRPIRTKDTVKLLEQILTSKPLRT